MKKIFLLGDSIRMGYESFVREKLKDRAVVFSPAVNGEFAQYTLRHLSEWAAKTGYADEISLVHWNNGLWDVGRIFGDECLTPLAVYAETIRRIHKRIGVVFPKAKIIFALSTSVAEEQYGNRAEFFRLNSDIREFNAAASRVMKELGTEVNDLYAVAAAFTPDKHSDATHFTAEGCDMLADAVAAACAPYL